MNEWIPLLVLPNLAISDWGDAPPAELPPGAIGLERVPVAILPGNCVALQPTPGWTGPNQGLLHRFFTVSGQPYIPAVLAMRSGTPRSIAERITPALDFRNAIAISCVLAARMRLESSGGSAVAYSDFFDVHPIRVAASGQMASWTDVQTTLYPLAAQPHFSHSPQLSPHSLRLFADTHLAQLLAIGWRHLHIGRHRKTEDWRQIFRALAAAYLATAATTKLVSERHEYGLQVSLWVTALETLARSPTAEVNRSDVYALLDGQPSGSPHLAVRRYRHLESWGRGKQNALQRLTYLLYAARNDFAHGREVRGTILVPRAASRRTNINHAAAIVFRAALIAAIERRGLAPQHGNGPTSWNVTGIFSDVAAARTLARIMGVRVWPAAQVDLEQNQ